jgi:hypothetical protein
MKKFILLASLVITTSAFSADLPLESFVGTYKVVSCDLSGLLKNAYLKNSPDLKNIENEIKAVKVTYNSGEYEELDIEVLKADGSSSSSFGSNLREDDLDNINQGRRKWRDNSWGTRYFSETTLKGSKLCHESSEQDDFCMELSKDSNTMKIKFTPNIGLEFSCKAVRK